MKYLDADGIGRVSRIGLGTWQFGSRESPGAKSGCHSQRRPLQAVADVLSWSNWRRKHPARARLCHHRKHHQQQ
jgi:hypothetical protein